MTAAPPIGATTRVINPAGRHSYWTRLLREELPETLDLYVRPYKVRSSMNYQAMWHTPEHASFMRKDSRFWLDKGEDQFKELHEERVTDANWRTNIPTVIATNAWFTTTPDDEVKVEYCQRCLTAWKVKP